MTWRAVCPEHSDLGPASSKVVFLEELGMTWSTEECTEQLGSSKDFLKRELRVLHVHVCVFSIRDGLQNLPLFRA